MAAAEPRRAAPRRRRPARPVRATWSVFEGRPRPGPARPPRRPSPLKATNNGPIGESIAAYASARPSVDERARAQRRRCRRAQRGQLVGQVGVGRGAEWAIRSSGHLLEGGSAASGAASPVVAGAAGRPERPIELRRAVRRPCLGLEHGPEQGKATVDLGLDRAARAGRAPRRSRRSRARRRDAGRSAPGTARAAPGAGRPRPPIASCRARLASGVSAGPAPGMLELVDERQRLAAAVVARRRIRAAGDVDHDRRQPGVEAELADPRRPPAAEGAVGPDERVLGDVLGVGRVAEHPQRDREQPILARPDQAPRTRGRGRRRARRGGVASSITGS